MQMQLKSLKWRYGMHCITYIYIYRYMYVYIIYILYTVCIQIFKFQSLFLSTLGFFNHSSIDIFGMETMCVCMCVCEGGLSCHCRIFSIILGLYPSNIRSIAHYPNPTPTQMWWAKVSPGIARYPHYPLGNKIAFGGESQILLTYL